MRRAGGKRVCARNHDPTTRKEWQGNLPLITCGASRQVHSSCFYLDRRRSQGLWRGCAQTGVCMLRGRASTANRQGHKAIGLERARVHTTPPAVQSRHELAGSTEVPFRIRGKHAAQLAERSLAGKVRYALQATAGSGIGVCGPGTQRVSALYPPGTAKDVIPCVKCDGLVLGSKAAAVAKLSPGARPTGRAAV